MNAARPRCITTADFAANVSAKACAWEASFVRQDPADEPKAIRFFGTEAPTGEQQLERTMATDDARKVGEMYRGNDADINFGVSKCRALSRQDDIA